MPNGKRNRRPRVRPKSKRSEMPSCAEWFLQQVGPLVRRNPAVGRRSRRHLRNATIEVLEAVKALLDETIDFLRREGRAAPELKRIRVEG